MRRFSGSVGSTSEISSGDLSLVSSSLRWRSRLRAAAAAAVAVVAADRGTPDVRDKSASARDM
jgi:hypothetical protein